MPEFTEYTFASTNGRTKIRVRRCDPDRPAVGVVQIAHGVAEHIERYEGFMRFLAENGYVAVGSDHLGHGASITDESELGWFAENDGWDLIVSDMHRVHDTVFAGDPGVPYFLFGHSMGSFAARTYLIKYPAELDGAIICGTGQQSASLVSTGKATASLICRLRGTKYRSKLLAGMAFGSYNKAFEPKRTNSDWLSRDEAVVDKYEADPLCGYIPTAGLFRDMMGGIEFISKEENLEKMRKDLPVLFISGEMDPVGDNGKGPERACAAFKKAGMKDVSIKLYPDCRHELLNELNKEEVMADVLAWLNARLPTDVETY